ncbi:putative Xaa-Pro aminopeptidase [Coniochaeta sp. 2T2.1]|nr:putative Xaa-Pro aminopeptidase [Coniochaeta sp. 2T2.1]
MEPPHREQRYPDATFPLDNGSSDVYDDDLLDTASETSSVEGEGGREFNHDLVFIDEFDALSIELKGLGLATQQRPAILSAQHAASAGPPVAQAGPSVAVNVKPHTEASRVVGHEGGLKGAPKLGKYPAREHARKVAKQLGVLKGLIYLPGQVTQHYEDSDQGPAFHQRRYFYYITGANHPNCAVTYDIARDLLILWIPLVEPRQALYFGAPPSPKVLMSQSDLSDVRYTTELPRYLRTYLTSNATPPSGRTRSTPCPSTVFILHPDQTPPIGSDTAPGILVLDSTRLQPAMDESRVIKSSYEIAAIRRANAISSAAHRAVLTRLKRMTNEREIEALFRGYCLAVGGAREQAYPVIVGSGSNGATLHYDANDEDFVGRQTIVLDAGCEWALYASDITRTLPVGGKLTAEGRAVYGIVERMQERCIGMVRPGVPYWHLQLEAVLVAIDGLLELGILRGKRGDVFAAGTVAAFFPHGLGHHVGLDVHDRSGRETLILGASTAAAAGFGPAAGMGGRRRGAGAAGKREWITPEMMASMCRDARTVAMPFKGRQSMQVGMVVTVEPGM